MSTSICIQDPNYSNSFSLHEALNLAGESATFAAGAYAFVSKGGVDLLTGSPWFEKMLGQNLVSIIVGMDAITNEAALLALQNIKERFNNFKVQAFLQNSPNTLFHPKVFWFRNDEGGVIVTGSGNLTVGGLRRNKEIFSINRVNPDELELISERWHAWLEENQGNLFEIDAEEVKEKAILNNVIRVIDVEEVEVVIAEQPAEYLAVEVAKFADVDEQDWLFDTQARILVAQIPKSSRRWSQANFTLSTFEDFFGGVRGDNSRRLILRAVLEGGGFGGLEDRPCVSVKSNNFRLELAAAAGLDYPEENRPIGVFVRVSVRMFLYYLCLPESQGFDDVNAWLDESWSGPGREMKRVETSVEGFRGVLNNLPLIALLN